ncbi:MAG: RNA pseudouridine synthase [Bacteroidetes bacterium]|nr:MAG: RNA pseudouridine synthase [Bacteroidota bacterium]
MHKFDVIFENEEFVVINKSAGLLSIPDRPQASDSLKALLQKKYGDIFVVHRLDKETSGLIVFARSEHSHKWLSQLFEGRSVEKIYLGLVYGHLVDQEGTIEQPVAEHPGKNGVMVIHKKGKPAKTLYKVEEEFGSYSLIKFQILTGRTHQIRLHMQWLGHSLVCDPLYGNASPIFISSFKRNYKLSKNEEEERPILSRLGLHSHELRFADPKGVKHEFKAEMPKDMRALIQQLRKNN